MANREQKNQKDSLKVREFEWYEVETKVREIMGELLQPFNKKQTQDTIKISDLKRTQANILKKLQDHDFLLSRENAQKPAYLQMQDDKIAQLSQSLTKNHISTQSRTKRMEAVIAVYEQKVAQLNEFERRLDKEVLQRLDQFRRYKETIDKEVALMVSHQDSHTEEMGHLKSITKSAVSKMQTKMISFDNRLKELEDQQRHRSSDVKKLMEDGVAANERVVKLDLKVDSLSARVEDRERDSKLSEKFMSKVKQIQTEFKFLSNFLQQYQPLYTQMQISQTLNSFIEGKQRRKLCIYEQQTFADLHQHILLDQKLTLADMMTSYSGAIGRIVNRNKKFVIDLAVAETIRCGGNIYEFRIEDMDMEAEEDPSKKAVPSIDPSQIARAVNQHLEGVRADLKQLVAQGLVPTRTWMKELQDQLLIRQLEYDSKYQQLKKQAAQLHTHQQLEEKQLRTQLGELGAHQEQLTAAITNFKEYVRDILNFSSVVNHIVIQDEIDRQATALYGLRAEKAENVTPPTIQLDPSCLNCDSRTAGTVQKAFKIACLTYNPSQIKIDDQMFSREEILEISTSILEKLKKRLYNTEMAKSTIQKGLYHSPTSRANNEVKKKSTSTIKNNSFGNQTARTRDIQTLLPTLGASKQRQRRSQLSVLY